MFFPFPGEGNGNPWGNMRVPGGTEQPEKPTDQTNRIEKMSGGQQGNGAERFGGQSPFGSENFGGFSPAGGGQGFGNMSDVGNRPVAAQSADSSQMTGILLIVSVLVLTAGLVIAGKFRR